MSSSTPPTSSSTGDPTHPIPCHDPRSNDTYVYGVGIVTFLTIGVCVFFVYNNSQAKNKKITNEEKQDEPPKRCPML